MGKVSKALIVCTAASLVATVVTTVAAGIRPLIWMTWILLAIVTGTVAVADRRGPRS
ncbi:hypothetical protein ACGFYP_33870 [Streptomyces sp. NPDC048370]|uniref:hypothetical protein n=1 Tax=Streptomyces sp. NPDC048370 TaxID=3365540 RepID=UPI00371EE86E